MGEVYLAEDTVLGGVSVAVKVMSQGLPTKAMLDKFASEAKIGAFLGHHNVNIVRVLDFGIHADNVPFYVMEYVYGTTLADEIKSKPLAISRAIRLMSQVCAGLQSAHQGVLIGKKLYSVIHRDLKPSNIFLTNNATFGEMAKILDFGISEFFLPTHKSTEANAMGTLAYSSSQQLLGEKLEPNSDIYSLGITLFEAITGHLPIQPKINTVHDWIEAHHKQKPRTLKQVAPHLNPPEALEQLVQKCLAKKSKNRPQTIQEVLDALKSIADNLGTNFPLHAQSHEDILDELFDESEIVQPIPQSKPSNHIQPPKVLQPSTPAPRPMAATPMPPEGPHVIHQTPKSIAQGMVWPATKPMAEIVFAQTIQTSNVEKASVWAMLNYAQQQWQSLPYHHIEFMVEWEHHPMLAWVTILHDLQGHMRCLPCYIDLGDPRRWQLIDNLIHQGEYVFILFGQKNPDLPVQVSTFEIDPLQQQFLRQNWLKACDLRNQKSDRPLPQTLALAASKQKLQARYRSLKDDLSQILQSKISQRA